MNIHISIKLNKLERAIVVLAGLAAVFIMIYAAGNMPNRENLFSCETTLNKATGAEVKTQTVNNVLSSCQEQIISAIMLNYKIAFMLRFFIYWTISVLIVVIALALIKWVKEEQKN